MQYKHNNHLIPNITSETRTDNSYIIKFFKLDDTIEGATNPRSYYASPFVSTGELRCFFNKNYKKLDFITFAGLNESGSPKPLRLKSLNKIKGIKNEVIQEYIKQFFNHLIKAANSNNFATIICLSNELTEVVNFIYKNHENFLIQNKNDIDTIKNIIKNKSLNLQIELEQGTSKVSVKKYNVRKLLDASIKRQKAFDILQEIDALLNTLRNHLHYTNKVEFNMAAKTYVKNQLFEKNTKSMKTPKIDANLFSNLDIKNANKTLKLLKNKIAQAKEYSEIYLLAQHSDFRRNFAEIFKPVVSRARDRYSKECAVITPTKQQLDSIDDGIKIFNSIVKSIELNDLQYNNRDYFYKANQLTK